MTDDELAAQRLTFAEEVATLARGTLNDEATMALADVVAAVGALGKKGTLTLVLTVEPAGSSGRTVLIGGEVKAKPPTPAPEVTTRFVGEDGSLHLDDPYARRIPGIPHVDADGNPKVVDASTGEVRRLTDSEVASLPRPFAVADGPTPADDQEK